MLSRWSRCDTAGKIWVRLRSMREARSLFLTSLAVTVGVLGVRQLGLLQSMELSAFDGLMRLRPAEKLDPRLLIVTITEADIQRQKKWPLSDRTFNTLLTKLQSYQPRVIGLDIYRSFPSEPGHKELAARLGQSNNIITICEFSSAKNPYGIPPPPTVPAERVGFSDLLLDNPDNIVRRSLLYGSSDQGKCRAGSSFAVLIALAYLNKEGINDDPSKDYLQLNQTVFRQIDSNAGGYHNMDAAGYQMLINYRAGAQVQQVTLTQVLSGQVDPNLVRDRIVLIGTLAPETAPDDFLTPYSAVDAQHPTTSGVIVHAQIASQIVSAVKDGRSLIWYFPDWVEAVWIASWSLAGGYLGWRLRHPLRLSISASAALSGLVAICYGFLLRGGWIPSLPPALALVTTSVSVVAYKAYQTQLHQQEVAQHAREQAEAIALLTTLLKENSGTWNQHNITVDLNIPEESRSASPVNLQPLLSGRYKITKALGSGGFGQTYLAQDTQRPGNPICVVKHLMPARRDTKFLQVARRLFHTEAEILEALGSHSQIPQLLAYFENNKEFFLVEEYIQGDALCVELPTDKRQTESFAIDMLKDVLEVLAFIHAHQVIHRDIKPSNIIRRKQDNRLVLIDFGAVKQMQPPQERTELPTVAIGTRGYAPPEQFAGHPRLSSDIYALGMIGVQAVTGIPPHQLQPDPETGNVMWRHLANVSDQFALVLDQMVRYHFSDRYKSAIAVLHDLKNLAETGLSVK